MKLKWVTKTKISQKDWKQNAEKENMGNFCNYLRTRNAFIIVTQKHRNHKGKEWQNQADKKFKYLYIKKYSQKKNEKWRKIVATHTTEKCLIFLTY